MPTLQCLLMLVVAGGGLAPADGAKKFQGKIHSTADQQVVLMVGTELMTFVLDKDTDVTLDGKAAKPTDLKPGDEAEVLADRKDDNSLYAKSVKATRATATPLAETRMAFP